MSTDLGRIVRHTARPFFESGVGDGTFGVDLPRPTMIKELGQSSDWVMQPWRRIAISYKSETENVPVLTC
jgi:hypothetical protein